MDQPVKHSYKKTMVMRCDLGVRCQGDERGCQSDICNWKAAKWMGFSHQTFNLFFHRCPRTCDVQESCTGENNER